MTFGSHTGSVTQSMHHGENTKIQLSHDTTKRVFGVSEEARHKPACAATEATYSLEISAIESRDIILSKQRTTKALVRLQAQADLRLCCSHMT